MQRSGIVDRCVQGIGIVKLQNTITVDRCAAGCGNRAAGGRECLRATCCADFQAVYVCVYIKRNCIGAVQSDKDIITWTAPIQLRLM